MKTVNIFLFAIISVFLCDCKGSDNSVIEGTPLEMRHARNIKMTQLQDGVSLISLVNPWDTTRTLAKYVLVDKKTDVPDNLPEDAIVIRTPLEKTVVYSGVHVSLLDELGVFDAVDGICDIDYVQDPKIRDAIAKGLIKDCGKNTSPVLERIICLSPEAVLLSPYENSDGTAVFSKTSIKTIMTADYMESTPLARAEWMRFYGRLFGKGETADSLFKEVESRYNFLKQKTAGLDKKPSVLFDRLYSGVWDVPTSGSVTGKLIEDAGGKNPFAVYDNRGAARLPAEKVLELGKDADIWLIRYLEPSLTLSSLSKENSVYSQFKAFKQGNVYGANTLETTLFEDGSFHPDKTLREMVRLLHPDLEKSALEYYRKL